MESSERTGGDGVIIHGEEWKGGVWKALCESTRGKAEYSATKTEMLVQLIVIG